MDCKAGAILGGVNLSNWVVVESLGSAPVRWTGRPVKNTAKLGRKNKMQVVSDVSLAGNWLLTRWLMDEVGQVINSLLIFTFNIFRGHFLLCHECHGMIYWRFRDKVSSLEIIFLLFKTSERHSDQSNRTFVMWVERMAGVCHSMCILQEEKLY